MPKTPDEVALDFSSVKPFEPMDPEVTYLCRTSKLELGIAKSSGNPKASLELTIDAPDEVQVVDMEGEKKFDKDGSPLMTKASGRKLFREYSLKAEALPFLHEYIKASEPGAELDENFVFQPKNYIGTQCAVKIQNEEYLEQVRPRVRRVLPAAAYQG